MKYILAASMSISIGCANLNPIKNIRDRFNPYTYEPNIVEKIPETSPEDLKKGPHTPGRILKKS
jgi:hypothetical protein